MRKPANTPHSVTHRQSGFTILELMIATIVFSVILLVITAGIMRFTDTYIKGNTSNNTQAVARSIMTEISQAVQFNPDIVGIHPPGSTNSYGTICASGNVYTYAIGQEVLGTAHGLIKDANGSCDTPNLVMTNTAHELLGQHMRLGNLDVSCDDTADRQCTIDLMVISGEDDMLSAPDGDDWSDVRCLNQAGSQFCAVSHLTSIVQQRVRQD